MSSSKNLEYQKTSFLSKSNSAFIEEMYLKFINKDTDLPESWKKYFSQIGEELDIVAKEINGPSWNPGKKKANLIEIQKKFENQYENIPEENTLSKVSENDLSEANGESFLTEPGKLSTLIAKSISDATGRNIKPELATDGGTSDARFIKDYCEVVELGIRNQTLHQVDEFVFIEDIKMLQKVYLKLLENYFNKI